MRPFPTSIRFLTRLCLLLALFSQAALPQSTPKVQPKTKVKTDTKALAKEIAKILEQPEIERGFWALHVEDADGKVLFTQNAGKLFKPASNMKLFTTAAAYALLGPDYKFRTTVESAGTIDKRGRLVGDLVIVGRGDPNLSGRTLPYNGKTERSTPHLRFLENLADQVAASGVKYVDGDIIADDTWFAFDRYPEGWAQDDLMWEYGAPVSALTVNDNVIFLEIQPADRASDRAFVRLDPVTDYYHVDNRIVTMPAGSGPRRIAMQREPGSMNIILWGTIPLDDPGTGEALAIDDPAAFTARTFRRMLEARGVVVLGENRTRHLELANLNTIRVDAVPAGGGEAGHSGEVSTLPQPLVLATHESLPLGVTLPVINKVSQNLHTELTLRALGKERGLAGTNEGGLEVLKNFTRAAGLEETEFAFYDGSGLSRQDLVSPHGIVKLLQYAAAQPWGQAYKFTLPVAAQDGSLRDRFRGAVAAGRVFAKTGSLANVTTLAGYLTTLSGQELTFTVMSNNNNLTGKRARDTIDQLVQLLVDDTKRVKKK